MPDLSPVERLRRGEYAFPGPLRDRLVSAILNGTKTSTACLLAEYEPGENPLAEFGTFEAVVDSHDRVVCITQTTSVCVMRLADVSDAHAIAEGEGYRDAAEWRDGHERFWTSPEYVSEVGQVELTDNTPVVCFTFEVVKRFGLH